MHSRVSVATNQTQIGTMMITIDHWKSDGSAAPVTFSITGTSTEHGAADSESRMFYCAKSSAAEREEGLEWLEPQVINTATPPGSPGSNSPRAGAGRTGARRNHHPTVKPIDLMRYLCRLVTPPGGTVLDPFAGSGSTLIAAYREGFASIGIERDKDYFEMATERVKNATAQMRLAL
jgi:site-specific DNA-methyltransferase (adenine-specific)